MVTSSIICLNTTKFAAKHSVLQQVYQDVLSPGIESVLRARSFENLSNQDSRLANSQVKLLIQNFDHEEIRHLFGYGSGVVAQEGYSSQTAQIDLMIITDDTRKFQKLNFERHPSHYSSLKYFGSDILQAIQNFGAGIYFNPFITMSSSDGSKQNVKYGIVSTKRALEDLCEWSTMYVAGRLQKPVQHLKIDELLLKANQFNLSSAFNVGLLLMSSQKKTEKVALSDLYRSIASISYMGDPRMIIGGENPNKVQNIVTRQQSKFRKLYNPFFQNNIKRGIIDECNDQEVRIRLDEAARSEMIYYLPKQFRQRLLNQYIDKRFDSSSNHSLETDSIEFQQSLETISRDENLEEALKMAIQATVAIPAFKQTMKGLLTAGLFKFARYAWEKKLKSWKRR